jgi:hypothetical protein
MPEYGESTELMNGNARICWVRLLRTMKLKVTMVENVPNPR